MTDDMRERARELIGRLGFPQRDVAERIGIDESKLTKTLSGVRRFTISELAALAELGQTTTDWLISGRQSRSVAFAFRAAEAAVEDDATMHLSDEVEMIADRRAALVEGGFIGAPRPLPKVQPTSFDLQWAAQAAALAVTALDAQLGELRNEDLFSLVESVFDADIIVRSLPDACDGASYEDEDGRIIVLAQGSPAGRQRFTLAHELGHLFNGDSFGKLLGETVRGSYSKIPSERRANVFAAAFLMPEDEVRGWLDGRDAMDYFDEFVCTFNVSPASASFRLMNLKLIPEADQSRLGHRTSKDCAAATGREVEVKLADASAMVPRRPLRLLSAATAAYRSGQIATGPVAALLGVSRDSAREILNRREEPAVGEGL